MKSSATKKKKQKSNKAKTTKGRAAAPAKLQPQSEPVATALDMEKKIDHATDAVIEEVESIYHSQGRKHTYRNHDRYDFHESVRICPADLEAAPTGPSMMAQGENLSFWGVSLIPPQEFAVDDCLLIEFTIRGDGRPRAVTMLAQVRHKRANDEGSETLGCQFLETHCPIAVPALG